VRESPHSSMTDPSTAGTCQGGSRIAAAIPPLPTCTDGIKNGSESGVDCGGSCPPCATGQDCTSRNDCAGALCSGGMCETCTLSPADTCGTGCFCGDPPLEIGGPPVCVKSTGSGTSCQTSACPPGTICINNLRMPSAQELRATDGHEASGDR